MGGGVTEKEPMRENVLKTKAGKASGELCGTRSRRQDLSHQQKPTSQKGKKNRDRKI